MKFENKILYILGIYPNLSETFVEQELKLLSKYGFNISVFSFRKTPKKIRSISNGCIKTIFYAINGIPISIIMLLVFLVIHPIRVSRGFGYTLSNIANRTIAENVKIQLLFFSSFQVVYLLKKEKIKRIHAHFQNAAIISFFVKLLNPSIQYSFTAHASADIYKRPLLLEPILSGAKSVVTISEYNRFYIARIAGDQFLSNITVIPNSIEVKELKYKNYSHNITLLSIGNLIGCKGHDILIYSLEQIVLKYPEIKCIIIGDGRRKDLLDNLVKLLGLTKNVVLLGAKSHQETLQYYKKCDIFVHPSVIDVGGERDGLPTVLLEAISFALPVITTFVSANPELIINNETGLIIPENNPQLLAESVIKLIENRDLAANLSRNAYEHLRKNYDSSKNIKKLIEILNSNEK